MGHPREIAVIGAGAAGLAAAYDLAGAGHRVTVYEGAPEVGGLAAGFRDEGWEWSLEKFYHHWFASDRHILALIEELGAGDRVLFPRPVTVMYHRGRFYPFDSPLAALLFPGLGWGPTKLRFGLVGLYLRYTKNWKPLEKYTVEEWMTRWAGRRAYETMWRPMMVGKFGERYASQVNMAWMWARLHARTPRLGTFTGGFQAFLDLLAAHVRRRGARILLSTPVERLAPAAGGRVNLTVRGEAHTFDQVLCTTSPALFSRLAPDLPAHYRARLEDLKSLGAVCLVVALRRPLCSRYYWYNLPANEGFPFLALVVHTNYMDPAHYGGDHIVYCGDYLEPDHPYFDAPQEEIERTYLPALRRFHPQFDPSWVRRTWLFRARYAQPVPLVNHSERIPDLRTPLPNVWLASMSQVYPWDRGTNYAVEIGRRAARRMLEEPGAAP